MASKRVIVHRLRLVQCSAADSAVNFKYDVCACIKSDVTFVVNFFWPCN
jgi:hypothetical protein